MTKPKDYLHPCWECGGRAILKTADPVTGVVYIKCQKCKRQTELSGRGTGMFLVSDWEKGIYKWVEKGKEW